MQRPQILEEILKPGSGARFAANSAAQRLKEHIVFKEHAGYVQVVGGVLPEHRIFELQNVDPVSVNDAVQRPMQVVVIKLPDRMRQAGRRVLAQERMSDEELHGRTKRRQRRLSVD